MLAHVLQAMRPPLLKQRGRGRCKGRPVRGELGGLVGSELGSGLAAPLVINDNSACQWLQMSTVEHRHKEILSDYNL